MAKGGQKKAGNKKRKPSGVRGAGRSPRRARNVSTAEVSESAEPAVDQTMDTIPDGSINSEDQKNAESVFATLRVSPTPEAVVNLELKPKQPEEFVEEKAVVQDNDVELITEDEGVDEQDAGKPGKRRARKMSEHTEASQQSAKPSRSEKKERVVTVYEWEPKETDVLPAVHNFIRSYYAKFAGFLDAIDPEVRYAAGIERCETFDSEEFRALLEKLKNEKFQLAWPFDEKKFDASTEEICKLLKEVSDKVKLCMLLACAERGYDFTKIKRNTAPISTLWGNEIDPIIELKTLQMFIREMKAPIEKLDIEANETTRLWKSFDECFNEMLPALEKFDSETLATLQIHDSLATLHGRKERGFDITEDEVYQMLETSFQTEGYGDFPTTMLYCPSLLTSIKQLKLIVSELDKMSGVTDIRVKLSGVQAVLQIVQGFEDLTDLLEEMRSEPVLTMKKAFGFEPEAHELFKGRQIKRSEYLKIFYTAYQAKPMEDYEFSDEKIVSALLCFYLIFPAYEVNTILFKIIGSTIREEFVDEDKKMLMRALLKLPREVREKIEVGEEFMTGEISDNPDSMYYQIKNAIEMKRLEVDQLHQFFTANNTEPIISVEKVLRMCMKFIEIGSNQQTSVNVLNLLRRNKYKRMSISPSFFEDLLIFALSKYSLPDEKFNESKFKFIENVFAIVNEFKNNKDHPLQFDEQAVTDKWVDLGHHWFSMMYLSNKYPALNLSTLKIAYPWQSADMWDEKESTSEDPEKYAVLAKVSLAWPESSDLELIDRMVQHNVPQDVDRYELYKAMKNYVSGQTLSDFWKKSLIRAYDKKMKSLLEKKEDEQENQPPISEQGTDLKSEVPEDPSPSQVEEPKKAFKEEQEEPEAPLPKVESDGEGEEMNVKEEVKETENDEGEQANGQLIPLEERNDFMKYYPEEEWQALPEVVRVEIVRQRADLGY